MTPTDKKMNPKAEDLIKRLRLNSEESIRVMKMAAGTPDRLTLSFKNMEDMHEITNSIQSLIIGGELTNEEKLEILATMSATKENEDNQER